MRHILLLFILIVFAAPVTMHAQIYSWSQRASMSTVMRESAPAFTINGKAYSGMGQNYFYGFTDFWEYDPAANTWSQKASFSGNNTEYTVAFSIGNKGYIGTGQNIVINPSSEFWQYDPAANTWTQKAPVPGVARSAAYGFSIGGKGYIGGGINNTPAGTLSDFYEYDTASNAWTQKASLLGLSRDQAFSFAIGSKGYVGAGYHYLNGYSILKDFYEYNPAANAWTQKADFGGSARGFSAAFSANGYGYAGTGDTTTGTANNPFVADFWQYNPATNTWTQKAPFGGGVRTNATGFAIGNTGYMAFGTSTYGIPGNNAAGRHNDVWAYVPALQTGAVQPAICVGYTINVPYTVTALGCTPANIFTAQLSNATGSFASPVNIGSLADTTSDTIHAVIPYNTPAGTGYRIRVISSSPVDTGTDNGTNITINAAISPLLSSVSITAQHLPACNGQIDTFTATAVNAGANPSYTWKKNNATAGANNPVFSYIPNSGDSVYAILTTDTGCYYPHVDTSNKIAITLAPPDLSTYYATPLTFCLGDSVTLNADIVTPGLMYHWQLNGHDITGASTGFYTAKATGVYNAVLTEGSCTSGTALITVTTHAPVPVISVNGFTFSTTSAFSSYQWYANGHLLQGATTRNYLDFNTTDSVTVAVTDSSGCKGFSAVAQVRLGVENVSGNAGFTFYPNPAKDNIVLTGAPAAGKVQIALYDIVGRLITTLYVGDAAALQPGAELLLPAGANGWCVVKMTLNGKPLGQSKVYVQQ